MSPVDGEFTASLRIQMHHISWSGTEQPVVVRGGGQDAASFKRWTLSAPSRASYVGYTFF